MTGSLAKGICDRCGFEYPLNQLRKEWTGLRVCSADYDRRHPQEFVRGVPDNQTLHDPRPEPAPIFVVITPVDDGLWTDAGNWSDEGVWSDGPA